jgi:hypothetical protein
LEVGGRKMASNLLMNVIDKKRDEIIVDRIPPARTYLPNDVEVPIEAGKHYVQFTLNHMYLKNRRELWVNFMPVVHAYPSFNHRAELIEPPVVIKPKIPDLDMDGHGEHAVVSDKLIFGPVPYETGNISISLALLKVPTTNYATELFDVMESITGINTNFGIKASLNVIKPVEEKICKLLDLQKTFVFGRDMTFFESGDQNAAEPLKSGFFMIIGPGEEKIEPSRIFLTKNGLYHMDDNGKPTEEVVGRDYLVFQIQAIQSRSFKNMTSLSDSYWNVRKAIGKKYDAKMIQDELDGLRQLFIECDDILNDDIYKQWETVKKEFEEIIVKMNPTLNIPSKTTKTAAKKPPRQEIVHEQKAPEMVEIQRIPVPEKVPSYLTTVGETSRLGQKIDLELKTDYLDLKSLRLDKMEKIKLL